MTDSPTIQERYTRITGTSDLTVHGGKRCDADILLAAGFAAARDARGALALDAYRLSAQADMQSLARLLPAMDDMLNRYLSRGGRRPMAKAARRALVLAILQWWAHPVCSYCEGRGFDLLEGAPQLGTSTCHACAGTGVTPLGRIVPAQLEGLAAWLAAELERMTSFIQTEMGRRLSNRPQGEAR